MSWQLLLVIYLVLATGTELLRRKLGKSIPQYNRLVNAASFIGTHLPSGFIAAHIIGYDLDIGVLSLT